MINTTKYESLAKRPPQDSSQMKQAYSVISKLFETCTDVYAAKKQLEEMVEGQFKKYLELNNKRLREGLGFRLDNIEAKVKSCQVQQTIDGCYLELEPQSARKQKFYQIALNASSISRFLPISCKYIDEERLEDLVDSKVYSMTPPSQPQLKVGKDEEAIAITKISKSFNGLFTKTGMWLNSQTPFIVSQPDGIISKDGHYTAVVEIKVLAKAKNKEILDDIRSLKRGSELGIKVDEAGNLDIRRGGATFQQIQTQLYTTGLKKGYLVIYSPFTGATFTKCLHRDEEMIQNILERAVHDYPRIYDLASPLLNQKPQVAPRQEIQISNEDLLPFGDWLSILRELEPKPTDEMKECDFFDKLLQGSLDGSISIEDTTPFLDDRQFFT